MAKIRILQVFIFLLACIMPAHAAITTTALAITGIVMSAIAIITSTALGVTSAVMQSKQAKAQAEYQEQVNLQNAKASREAAQAKIENQRRQAKFTQGTQLARLGGMGALAEGSPLDLMGQTAGQVEYDTMVTEYEGEVQAIQFQQQAALNQYEADVADYNLGLNVAGELAKGVSSLGSSLLGGSNALSNNNIGNNVGTFSTSSGAGIDIGADKLYGTNIA